MWIAMRKRNWAGGVLLLQSTAWMGCVGVHAEPEYERASEIAAAATGFDETYTPDGDEALAQRVDGLLEDGLTVDEAAQIALLNNRDFQAAWMNIGMAKADLVQAGLLSNPSFFSSFRLPDGGGLSNVELTLAQNIADLWLIPIRRRVAAERLEQSILDLARRASLLAANAEQAYYRVLGTRGLRENADENARIAGELLELAIARQQAGAGTELEVNLARSAVLEAQINAKTARLDESSNRRDLAKLLGLHRPMDELELTSGFPAEGAGSLDTERLIIVAQEARMDLDAARRTVAAAEASLKVEYARIIPSVELGVAMERASRKRQGSRDLLADTARASIANGGLTAPDIQPRSERRSRDDTDVIVGPSIGLELPIFDQNQAQIARAEFALQQATKQLESLEIEVAQDIRNAADRLDTAWMLVRFYEDNSLPLGQRNLEMTREAYRVGSASVLAVLEAQRFLLDARRRYIEALQSAAMRIPELQAAVGRPLARLLDTEASTQPTGD